MTYQPTMYYTGEEVECHYCGEWVRIYSDGRQNFFHCNACGGKGEVKLPEGRKNGYTQYP